MPATASLHNVQTIYQYGYFPDTKTVYITFRDDAQNEVTLFLPADKLVDLANAFYNATKALLSDIAEKDPYTRYTISRGLAR